MSIEEEYSLYLLGMLFAGIDEIIDAAGFTFEDFKKLKEVENNGK